MNEHEKLEMKFQIGRTFTPSAPIDSAALFAGRKSQITRLVNAVTQRGQHAALFGERGVGKTSLANVLKEFLVKKDDLIIVSTNCETAIDFKSIWTNVFKSISLVQVETGMGFNPTTHEASAPYSTLLSDSPSPEEIRQLIERLKKSSVIIIDEMDRIKDKETTTRLADTIKTLQTMQ